VNHPPSSSGEELLLLAEQGVYSRHYCTYMSSIIRVGVLGMSVDPEHDTQADAQRFSADHGLASAAHWHYLLGTRAQLSPIWSAYAVQGLPPSVRVISTSQMIHSSVVYLIDQQGREQALLDYDFTPAELAHDVAMLLGLNVVVIPQDALPAV
jgi:cytochrome oxidase Cu insertion factor (SCO1/SenC/PrrC family)